MKRNTRRSTGGAVPRSGGASIRPVRLALVGADGAGKSTISGMLESSDLPFPVKRIYMGVNLEASTDMLPTTRMLFAAKRIRHRLSTRRTSPAGAADASSLVGSGAAPVPSAAGARWRRTLKDSARLTTWMTEEWLRQLLAVLYTRRGYIVVFDRHFFVDYHGSDPLVRRAAPTSRLARLHSWTLEHVYPRPDLVLCLDAPAEVLWARKQEDSLEWLEARRQQYLRLADDVPAFALVRADRPVDEVYADVVQAIRDYHQPVPAVS